MAEQVFEFTVRLVIKCSETVNAREVGAWADEQFEGCDMGLPYISTPREITGEDDFTFARYCDWRDLKGKRAAEFKSFLANKGFPCGDGKQYCLEEWDAQFDEFESK